MQTISEEDILATNETLGQLTKDNDELPGLPLLLDKDRNNDPIDLDILSEIEKEQPDNTRKPPRDKKSTVDWFSEYQKQYNNALSLSTIIKEQKADTVLGPIIDYISNDILPKQKQSANKIVSISNQYAVMGEALFRVIHYTDSTELSEHRLVSPQVLIHTVLSSLHNDVFGHMGIYKTYFQAKRYFYWKNMNEAIKKYVGNCKSCLTFKRNQHKLRDPLEKFARSSFPFENLHIDLLGPLKLSTCRRYRYIAVVVDRFSRFIITFPLRTKSQNEVVQGFYFEIICKHGSPSSLFSDRGSEFVNKVMAQLCSVFGIKQYFTSGYCSAANGISERSIQSIVNALRTSINDTGANWSSLLPQITYNLNTSVSKSSKYSPFFLLYGRKPKNLTLLHEIDEITAKNAPVLQQIIEGQTLAQQIAFDNINEYEDINRQHINATRPRIWPVKVGDFVYLFKPAINENDNQKFCAKFQGPYLITDLLPKGNCILKNPENLKIYPHPVHVSRLTLAKNLVEG
jgi:transposase InsO family protein